MIQRWTPDGWADDSAATEQLESELARVAAEASPRPRPKASMRQQVERETKQGRTSYGG